MQKISSTTQLREAIFLLEIRQKNEGHLLKEQFKTTFEGLKPVNLLKKTLHEIVTSPEVKEDVLTKVLSLAAGYVSKKIIMGTTHNPLKQILGTLLQMGVTGIVSKNSEAIKETVMNLINNYLGKKEESHDEAGS